MYEQVCVLKSATRCSFHQGLVAVEIRWHGVDYRDAVTSDFDFFFYIAVTTTLVAGT